ncbi:MAG: isoprenylcysteine carboxylmethyltransferase family protein [Planctomycetaceae bacterium]
MSSEELFRRIFVAILVVFLPFGLYHRIRSNSSGEKLDRWQEGSFILFGLRLGGLPWFIGGAAWMYDPTLMAWAAVPLPIWIRWSGFALISVWGVLFVWTFQTLGKNLTDTVVTRKEHLLVTSGPYRYVRHPFYLSFLFATLGGGVVTANWYLFVTGLLPFAFLVVRTRIEEEKLVERFGDEYTEYMSRTGRFWPRLRKRL